MNELQRFLDAQSYNYQDAYRELRQGRKQSCWMWYVFPQIAGLSRSSYGAVYALRNLEEAQKYAAHEVLGTRLRELCELLLQIEGKSAYEVLGAPDDLKLCSCMTLFEAAQPDCPLYGRVLDRYFDGTRDALTLEILRQQKAEQECRQHS